MKLPIIILIGKKNVGKSTLFNRLTRTNDALVANCPGLTRDLQYGYLYCKFFKSIIVDTRGITECVSNNLNVWKHDNVYHQMILAIKKSDIVLFVVDGRVKETSTDFNIVSVLRKLEKKIFIIVNKIDVISSNQCCIYWGGYHSFGIDNVMVVSAMHGYGINDLLKRVSMHIVQDACEPYSNKKCMLIINQDIFSEKNRLREFLSISSHHSVPENFIILAVVGRPNSGKSTFINSVLGENRMITCDVPGTTRDSIYTSTIYDEQRYVLIDTAGILKKKIFNSNIIDKISIDKTLQVIKDAHIILFMMDANIGVSAKDLSVLKYIMNIGMSLILVINKWDNISEETRYIIKDTIYRKINFIEFVQVYFISALYGSGIRHLFKSIQKIYHGLINIREVNTSQFTRIMRMAVIKRPPPLYHSKIRIQPKYVHVGGYNPLILVIHGSYVSKLSIDYQRYLKRSFYEYLNIKFAMLHLQLKDSKNPFV